MPLTLDHDGCRLHYSVRGEGPPVLFIAGAGTFGDSWSPQIDALAARFRCLSFDNRGMSRSQPVAGALSIERMADDALALMDAQGWESAHVVGHSMGGHIAQCLGLKARQRVRSLSLLCTFARGRSAAPFSFGLAWIGLRMQFGTRRARRRAFLQIVMPPDVLKSEDQDALAERLAPLFGHDLADQPPIVWKQIKAIKAYDPTPRLKELAGVPTLVVAAAHDRLAPPRVSRALADAIPGARYVEYADAAHGVPLQCPDRINDLLAEHFLKAG